ncbi:MAG TPA: hypothetical protein PK836_08420 [Syntrophales bacterium]|nr:hypothetical protein [Syntrophales bacterium]HOM06481.1 hypothetical protein [Syntrophales bacterium]HON99866.1 hypothetical protein [Syntrophales bacterium]HPC01690.1 hypothetical protein [Syntrophales bacterium]HPQ06257.1 hypothetical protein [Syntrophales bacterium]
MDPKALMKQMLDFNKTAFEKTFNALVVMQDQSEKMFNLWMEQNKFFPEEGRKAMTDWIKSYKKGRDEFKAKMDEGYRRLEEFFAGTGK